MADFDGFIIADVLCLIAFDDDVLVLLGMNVELLLTFLIFETNLIEVRRGAVEGAPVLTPLWVLLAGKSYVGI